MEYQVGRWWSWAAVFNSAWDARWCLVGQKRDATVNLVNFEFSLDKFGVPGQGVRLRLLVGLWDIAAVVQLLQGRRWAVVSTRMPGLWPAYEWDFNLVSCPCWMGHIGRVLAWSVTVVFALPWVCGDWVINCLWHCVREAGVEQPWRSVFHSKKAGGIRNIFHAMESGCRKRIVSPKRVTVLQGQWLLLRSVICSSDPKHSGCWLMISVVTIWMVKFKKVGNLITHEKYGNGDEIFICCILHRISTFTYFFNIGTSQLFPANCPPILITPCFV